MPKAAISFIVRDVGETQMLSDVARTLLNQGQRVQILALGQAAHAQLLQDEVLSRVLLSPDTVTGVQSRLGSNPDDMGGGRGHAVAFVAPGDAAALAHALEAPLVVTGVVSRAQRQLVRALRNTSAINTPSKIIGAYDSLAVNKHCFLFSSSREQDAEASGAYSGARGSLLSADPSFASDLDELWVPLAGLIVGVAHEAKIPEERVVEVGHPETEAVLARVAALQPDRDDIRGKKLGASPTDRVVYFAGGRDKPGRSSYAQAFSLFVRGALSTATHADSPLRIFATLHPASDGATERQILTELNAATAVRLLRAVQNPATPEEISNEELMVAADAVVTWSSTVGSQAALMPQRPIARPILFIQGSTDTDDFAVIHAGLAQRATDATEVLAFFASLSHRSSQPLSRAEVGMELEAHATLKIMSRLQVLSGDRQP